MNRSGEWSPGSGCPFPGHTPRPRRGDLHVPAPRDGVNGCELSRSGFLASPQWACYVMITNESLAVDPLCLGLHLFRANGCLHHHPESRNSLTDFL